MASSDDIVFTPAPGTTLAIPAERSIASFYAVSPRAAALTVKEETGDVTELETTDVPSVGGWFTYKARVLIRKLPSTITILHKDGSHISGPNTVRFIRLPDDDGSTDRDLCTSITLNAHEDAKSVLIDWLDSPAWLGWTWERVRPTWIEANFISSLTALASNKSAHCLLLQPSNTDEGQKHAPSEVLAVFPASSRDAFVTLTGSQDKEEPGVYARVRRVGSSGTDTQVHVVGKLTTQRGEKTAIHGAVQLARQKYGLSTEPFEVAPGVSPFDRLGFCTWSSIGEDVPLTKANMGDLVQRLGKDANDVPIETFIIDDGWQDIRHGLNGHPKSRGLWSFDTWDGMGCSLAELVHLIKSEMPLVKDVGVWMTLAGYWNSIAPGSPLEKKYGMKRYTIDRDNVPGQYWPADGFDGQQTGTIAEPEDRVYLLPPPERAAEYWKDYFSACATAGVSFVKVDNQAFQSFLAGVQGGEEFVAMWDAMFAAANDIFGPNRVIHCMAHYERTFNGDIGLGIPSNSQKVMVRNSDDFGLKRPNIHRNHIHYNLYNAMLLEQLACIPDADMFMTGAQWPEYHAVLRAFFSRGPILLADKPGMWDVKALKKLIAKDTTNEWKLVRSTETARLLTRNVWERTLDAGNGPCIKAASSFGAHGTCVILWSSRAEALYSTADILFAGDIVDALGETYKHPSISDGYVVWLGKTRKAISVGLQRSPDAGNPQDRLRHPVVMSEPIMAVSLPPEAVEVITVVPFWSTGSLEIGIIGLIDRYAGLAAIAHTELSQNKLITQVKLAGVLGLILRGKEGSAKVSITVDESLTKFSEESIGLAGNVLHLLKVDLSEVNPPKQGKSGWIVEVEEGTS